MKIIYNGIPCEINMNSGSSASALVFANIGDAIRAMNSDKECGYCHKTFRPFVHETVNGKTACPECREVLVPPIAVYCDRNKRWWGGRDKLTGQISPSEAK